MNRHEYIRSDASVLLGKPVIKGTCQSVELLPGPMPEGWTGQQVPEICPQLCPQALRGLFAFAAECTRVERVDGIGGTAG